MVYWRMNFLVLSSVADNLISSLISDNYFFMESLNHFSFSFNIGAFVATAEMSSRTIPSV